MTTQELSTSLDLQAFVEAGAIAELDLHLARTLARLGGETDARVLLAVALASRAPGRAHICTDLTRLNQQEATEPALPWPPLPAWQTALAGSPLVSDGNRAGLPRPMVLDGTRVYLQRYWRYQERLLAALQQRAAQTCADIDRALLRDGIQRLFPQEQQATGQVPRQVVGALMAVLRRLTVISGGPGTGKTTTVKRILALLLEQDDAARSHSEHARPPLRIGLAAPTGKAASRMVEALSEGLERLDTAQSVKDRMPREASTLHKLLGYQRRSPSRFRHDANNPLAVDVLVVDEASMVDFAMMTRLVEAVPAHARLVLLGDRDQLASVEAGAVLADICGEGGALRLSALFARELADLLGQTVAHDGGPDLAAGIGDCMVQLDHFYRFGAQSGIGTAARTVIGLLDGDLPPGTRAVEERRADRVLALLGGKTEPAFPDVDWALPTPDGLGEAIRPAIVTHYGHIVAAAQAGQPAEALQRLGELGVLCAHRSGPLGVAGVNVQVESWLAEAGHIPPRPQRQAWYAGQPLLVTENDYALGLMNGEVGVVARDPDAELALRAFFSDGRGGIRAVPLARLPQHVTNFAMTIHKSQGSQYRHVIVVLPARPSPIVTRELLYTGLTRASDHATVVGPAEVIRVAVATRVQRASGLGEKLWGMGE